jgi:putative endonuclease
MYVYILYSPTLKRYYKGVSEDPERRLGEHNQVIKKSAYTAISNDWELIFTLKCESKAQALKVERYLKKSANIIYLRRFINEEKLQKTILERFK